MMLLLINIPAEISDAVRAAAETGFGEVAKAAFVVAGLPTGEAPATDWWLAGIFAAETMTKIPALHSKFSAAHVNSLHAVWGRDIKTAHCFNDALNNQAQHNTELINLQTRRVEKLGTLRFDVLIEAATQFYNTI